MKWLQNKYIFWSEFVTTHIRLSCGRCKISVRLTATPDIVRRVIGGGGDSPALRFGTTR